MTHRPDITRLQVTALLRLLQPVLAMMAHHKLASEALYGRPLPAHRNKGHLH